MYGYPYGRYGHDWDGMWMGGPFHGVISIIMVVIFIIVAIAVVRWLWRAGHGYGYGCGYRHWHHRHMPGRGTDALAELDLRYARGEIEREEYLQRKRDLGGDAGG